VSRWNLYGGACQKGWDFITKMINPHLLFSGSSVVLFLSFCAVNVLFMFLDFTGKPKFLHRYKIQKDKNSPVSKRMGGMPCTLRLSMDKRKFGSKNDIFQVAAFRLSSFSTVESLLCPSLACIWKIDRNALWSSTFYKSLQLISKMKIAWAQSFNFCWTYKV